MSTEKQFPSSLCLSIFSHLRVMTIKCITILFLTRPSTSITCHTYLSSSKLSIFKFYRFNSIHQQSPFLCENLLAAFRKNFYNYSTTTISNSRLSYVYCGQLLYPVKASVQQCAGVLFTLRKLATCR